MKSSDDLYIMDPATGTISSVLPSLSGSTDNLLEFGPDDLLFTGLRTGGGFTLKTLDPSNGQLTDLGSNSLAFLSAIAFALGVQADVDHDGSLEEKTGMSGSVRDYDAAQLLEIEIGSWFDRTHPEVEE